jgi:hypothetical protein
MWVLDRKDKAIKLSYAGKTIMGFVADLETNPVLPVRLAADAVRHRRQGEERGNDSGRVFRRPGAAAGSR